MTKCTCAGMGSGLSTTIVCNVAKCKYLFWIERKIIVLSLLNAIQICFSRKCELELFVAASVVTSPSFNGNNATC
jgi:hypothetical protein